MFVSALHVGARWRLRVARQLATLQPIDRLLDAGCGEGFMTMSLGSDVTLAVGTDLVAEKTCRFTISKPANVWFVSSHIQRLAFPNDSFSVVVCTDVLEHVADVRATLQELIRVTEQGGRIVLTVPISDSHGHFGYSVEGFRQLIQDLGLTIEFFEKIRYGSVTTILRGAQNTMRRFLLRRDSTTEVDEWDKTFSYALKQSQPSWFKRKLWSTADRLMTLAEAFEPVPYRLGDGENLAAVLRVPLNS